MVTSLLDNTVLKEISLNSISEEVLNINAKQQLDIILQKWNT